MFSAPVWESVPMHVPAPVSLNSHLEMIRFVSCLFLAVATSVDYSSNVEAKNSRTSRILNGQDASIVDHPYMLIFFYVDNNGRGGLCSAAIIAEEWAITSAHCVLNVSLQLLRINYNVSDLNLDSLEVGVDKIFFHPLSKITKNSADYDIVLMKVTPAFSFGSGVQPVSLPDQDQDVPSGANGTITGWGQAVKDEDYPTPSEILQMGTVQTMNQSDCARIYAKAPYPLRTKVTDRMVCAQGVSAECMGDSGGPLVVDGKLVGIASWGSGKCYDYPNVFTRIAFFRDWIRNVTSV